MICKDGNISIMEEKYNLTVSNLGDLSFSEFNSFYENLTSSPSIREFNLDSREDDLTDSAFKNSYWRIYVPSQVGGNCSGNILFSAVKGVAS